MRSRPPQNHANAASPARHPAADPPLATPDAPGLDPSALSMPVAARLLGLTEAILQKHVDQGLPLNSDGTLSLLTYAAWLNGTDDMSDAD